MRLLTLTEINAIINPKQAAMLRAMCRLVASESQPMTGGPTKKPKKLMLDTIVMAMLALMVPSLPRYCNRWAQRKKFQSLQVGIQRWLERGKARPQPTKGRQQSSPHKSSIPSTVHTSSQSRQQGNAPRSWLPYQPHNQHG